MSHYWAVSDVFQVDLTYSQRRLQTGPATNSPVLRYLRTSGNIFSCDCISSLHAISVCDLCSVDDHINHVQYGVSNCSDWGPRHR
jgi:hypothetical protein